MNGSAWRDEHPLDDLPALVAGRLPPADAERVRRHLDDCAACALELAAWRSVAGAVVDRASVEGPSPATFDAIVDRIGPATPGRSVHQRVRWLVELVARQAPLVRSEIWPASTVVVAIGAVVSLMMSARTTPGTALALFAPLAAGIGIALIYGQQNDPSLELARATPTSPRLVVVARLVLVLAWDLALAVAASLLLAWVHGPQVAIPLIGLWLGPMLLLGCLSLVLSLAVGTTPAISVAAVLWVVRALELGGGTHPGPGVAELAPLIDTIWQTSPLTLGLSACALALALLVLPRADSLSSATAA